MKRRFAWLIFALLIAGPFSAARADLNSDVDAILGDKAFAKAEFGVAIARLGASNADSKVIYRRNAETPRTPASNMKVVTTSAVLDRLGADFKFRTMLVQHGPDLLLWGDGDPTLGDGDLLKKLGWNTLTVYKNWAAELKKKNIDSVRNVIVDDSVFDQVFYHPNWKESEYPSTYAAEVGGVSFNANTIDVVVQPGAAGKTVGYTIDPPTKYV